MRNTSEALRLNDSPNIAGSKNRDETISTMSKHTITAHNLAGSGEGGGHFDPPTMEDFGYPNSDLENDKKAIADAQALEVEHLYKRAKRRLERERNSDANLDDILKQMSQEEEALYKQFEDILYEGIGKLNWLSPSAKGSKFEVHSLSSVKNVDDYRNRIDAPFCLTFPENKKIGAPSENIFIGFDTTLRQESAFIEEKLTKSTNVTRTSSGSVDLPFGFSTLRYTYDALTFEKMPSDEVIRYTICASKKQIEKMQHFADIDSPQNNIDCQEICFKVLSQMHEQNKLYQLMNSNNPEIYNRITKVDRNIWRNISTASIALAKNDAKLEHLKTTAEATESIISRINSLPEEEKASANKQINNGFIKLYYGISEMYCRGDAGTKDNNYSVLMSNVKDYIQSAKNGKLDQFKKKQTRKTSFDKEGNIFAIDENGNKIYK